MKVVLAEKPSVARDLARFLGANSRQDGYFEGSGYQVTWALGHLVELKEPHEYDLALKRWTLAALPFVPARFELKVIREARSRKQFAVIKQLFRSADSIICATDAGREGELIFRYILEKTGCERKPVQRLWLSSLTEKAIREAFDRLRPGRDYDRLYDAARCRSESDWIVGLNATRYYTVRFGSGGLLWSVGRVQTPVLALIVSRDDEIRAFVPEAFWDVVTRYRDTDFKFTGDRFAEPTGAHALIEKIRDKPFQVDKVQRKPRTELPPQLYDLTELQRDMNRRYGMSAAGTLKAAQALYEAKVITYPRTDSRFLGSDMKKEMAPTLRNLEPERPREIGALNLDNLAFSSRVFDDKKVVEHHAIVPTGKRPGSLGPVDAKVYDAILTRLIAVFYPACEKEVTTVMGSVEDVPFRARGVCVVVEGWTALYPRKTGSNAARTAAKKMGGKAGKKAGDRDGGLDDDFDQELPAFTAGERGPHEPRVETGETRPPKPYNENTLLGAMETAGKLVDDEELRQALKDRGLGTPATRAAIIETLLRRGYIDRQKKTLLATDLGRYLIALLQHRSLKSAEMTGEWESRLREIERDRLDRSQFMSEIAGFTRSIVRPGPDAAIDSTRFGPCPLCGKDVIQGKRDFGCSGWRSGCSFVLCREQAGRELGLAQVRELLQHRTSMRPLTLATGESVILHLTDPGQVTTIPVPRGKWDGDGGAEGRGKGREGARGKKREKESGATVAREARVQRTGTREPGTREPGTREAGSREAGSRATVAREAGTREAAPREAGTREAAPREARSSNRPVGEGENVGGGKPADLGLCPLCQGRIIATQKTFGCAAWREGCRFVIWRTIAGKKVSESMARALLKRGETRKLKGFKSKAGKKFDAVLKLEDGQVKFVFDG